MSKKLWKNMKSFIKNIDFSAFIFSVAILVVGLCAAELVKWLDPGFFDKTTWELIMDSELAVVISLFNTVQIFWWLDTFKGVRKLLLPGKNEAEDAEAYLATNQARNIYAGYLFIGLSMRDSARIIAMILVFCVTFYVLSPMP